MKKGFIWLVLLIFTITVGIISCGGTSSDDIPKNSVQQIEESKKDGLGILFVDPNYCNDYFEAGNSRKKALDNDLGESDYIVSGENDIFDFSANPASIDEMRCKLEKTLTFEEVSDELEDSNYSNNNSRNFGGGFSVFGKFFVYIKGIHTHPLNPCVSNNVRHFNIFIKPNSKTSNEDAWANIHLGAWTESGKVCFVAFNNISGFCKKGCSPSRQDLQNLLEQSIKVALAAVGIYVSSYAVYVAAYTISCLLYPMLLVL